VLRTLTLVALILPLAIDTFVLSTALGAAGLARRERFRTSLLLTAFEAGMPVVGFLVGAGLGGFMGPLADFLAAAVLALIGVWMLWPRGDDEEGEERKVRLLESARGWAILVLGLSISLDELAIGFGAGLLRLPVVPLVIAIGVQTFIVTQAGIRLGSRLGARWRESAERVAGVALIALGVVLLTLRVAS
jgi:putative Mn2+ efflux pump MntP